MIIKVPIILIIATAVAIANDVFLTDFLTLQNNSLEVIHGTGKNKFLALQDHSGRYRISDFSLILALKSDVRYNVKVNQLPDNDVISIPILGSLIDNRPPEKDEYRAHPFRSKMNIDSKDADFLERIAEKYYTSQKSERSKITGDFKDFNPNFACIWGVIPLGEDTRQSVEDGHKFGCGVHLISTNPSPIVYSFGSNREQDFEAAILRIHPNARVYTFELDPTHIPSPSTRNPRVDWNNIGLGYEKSPNSIFKTFREIMISKGHSYIDILKMDIDGEEWNWIFQEGDLLQRIGQMLIEIHVVGLPKLIFPDKTVANLIDEIEKYDMRMFFKEINHAYPFCCTEMSFIQKEWGLWNVKKLSFQALTTTQISTLSADLGHPNVNIEASKPSCGKAVLIRGSGRKSWFLYDGIRHWVLRSTINTLNLENTVKIIPNAEILQYPEDELGFTIADCVLLRHPNKRANNVSSVISTNVKQISFIEYYDQQIKRRGTMDRTLAVFPTKIHGFADCMLGIVGTFVLSLITGRRFEIIQHRYFRQVSEVFNFPNYNLQPRNMEPWILKALESEDDSFVFNKSITDSGKFAGLRAHNRVDYLVSEYFFDSILNNKSLLNVFLINNRGPSSFFNAPHLREVLLSTDLNVTNVFNYVVKYLFHPKPEIFSGLENILFVMNNTSILKIAIQIRTGDRSLTKAGNRAFNFDTYSYFFSCAQQIEETVSRPTKWILYTDSMELRSTALQKFGSKVVTATNVPLEHSADNMISDRGFKTAVGEWWSMGEADYFVLSENSGFGKTAAARTMKDFPTNIYLLPSSTKTPVCNQHSFTSMDTLRGTWSGL